MLFLPVKQLPLLGLVLCVLCSAVKGWSTSSCGPFTATKALGGGSGVARMKMHLYNTSHRQISPYELGKFLTGTPQLMVFHRMPAKVTPFKRAYLEKQEEYSKVFQDNVQTLAKMTISSAQRQDNKQKFSATLEQARMQRTRRLNQRRPRKKIVPFPDFGVMQLSKLADILEADVRQLQRYLLSHHGIVVQSPSSSIDVSLAKELAKMAGYPVRAAGEEFDERYFQLDGEEDKAVDDGLQRRPPVVTVMGHVDHGKTTLLDTLRRTRVAKTEAGGITQHTNAYQVHTDQGDAITFVDTPGHEAFRAMRERGAKITDIVVLVVAADDGVMAQTKEVIDIITNHRLPTVVCITKMDKRDVKPDRVLADLMSYGIVVEDFGGDTQVARISATRNEGIDELLEKILVQAEMLELKANPIAPASGTVIEAEQTSERGTIAQVLVQQGTLRVGDVVLAGDTYGRIKEIFNSSEHSIPEAGPSTPVRVMGLNGVPKAGDEFSVTEDEEVARIAAETRQQKSRHEAVSSTHKVEQQSVMQSLKAKAAQAAASSSSSSSSASSKPSSKQQLPLKVVVKADVQGSLEALVSSLQRIVEEDEQAVCQVQVVASSVGPVSKNDVNIAHIAKASILAYGVDVRKDAQEHARMKGITVDQYKLLHDAVHGYTDKAKAVIRPPTPGKYLGRATVKQVFVVNKVQNAAGCQVADGVISARAHIRVLRDNRHELYRGPITSLRVVREEVPEVRKGQECGIMGDPNLQLQVGDIIECFEDPNAS